MKKKANFYVVILVSCLFFFSISYAKQDEKNLMHKVFDFYHSHISSIDGNRCPMYPSCSNYSKKVFEKHGFFMGSIMTFDRLIRCGGSELEFAEEIEVKGKKKCFDPVEYNDFWWQD